MRKSTRGNAGEDLATAFLKRKGYEILARNFKSEVGEIDIVASIGGCVVFVEVKTRKNEDFGLGVEAVTPAKRKRIVQTASQYLAKFFIEDTLCRFDIVEVYGEKGEIEHIEQAFDSYLGN